VKRDFYLSQFETPDLTAVMAALRPLADFHAGPGWTDRVYWQVYKLKAGRVYVDSGAVDIIKSLYRESVGNDDEAQRLAAVDQLCDLLTQMRELRPDWPPTRFEIPEVCEYNARMERYQPLPQFVKIYSVEQLTV
jgi:hypothetical protein